MIAQSEKLTTGSSAGTWRRRVWRYGPLVGWMAFIWYASSGDFSAPNTSRILGPLVRWLFPNISPERIAEIHFLVRKAAHFIEYAIFAFFAARALATSSRPVLRHGWFIISLLLVICYALVDEYHQSFVVSRTASVYDSLIDMSGGLTMLLLYTFWRRSQPGVHRPTSNRRRGRR